MRWQIQQCWSDTHGEDKYVIMYGSLHMDTKVSLNWNICDG